MVNSSFFLFFFHFQYENSFPLQESASKKNPSKSHTFFLQEMYALSNQFGFFGQLQKSYADRLTPENFKVEFQEVLQSIL